MTETEKDEKRQRAETLCDYVAAASNRLGLAEAKPEDAMYFYGQLVAMRADMIRLHPEMTKMISGIHQANVSRLLGVELCTGNLIAGADRVLILEIEDRIEEAT